MRRAIKASTRCLSSSLTGRLPFVSSASSGRPSDQVTSHAASSKGLPVPWPNETPACLSRSAAATTSSTSVMVRGAAPRAMPPRRRAESDARGGVRSCRQLLEGRAVDVLEHVEARDLDVLVDLVDARVDRAELD